MTQLRVENGRIILPPGLKADGARLFSSSRHHLLLAAAPVAGEIMLAGRIGEVAVADLLSFINMFRKSGVLHFTLAGGTKELFFDQGELVGAASTFPEEELGEFLCEQGTLDRDTLLTLRRQAGNAPDTLRQLLLQSGRVTAQQLWAASRVQVEAIVYHLVPCQSGDYVLFSARDFPEPRFALATQNLIMEGLRRFDERLLFMRTLRSLDALPTATGKADPTLSAEESRLLSLLGAGRLTVREAVQRSGLGEFNGLQMLYHLTRKGLVRIDDPQITTLPPEAANTFAILNQALATLYRQICHCNPLFGVEVRRFLRDLPQPYNHVFRHALPGEDGTLDPQRIAANLTGLTTEDQCRLLCEAMHELLFMTCVAARRDLGEQEAAGPVQRVQEICRRTRALNERNQE